MHTIKFRLIMDCEQRRHADHRFYLMWKLHNQVVKHATHRLNELKHSRSYKRLLKDYAAAKEADNGSLCKSVGKQLNEYRDQIGLSKTALEKHAAVMGGKFSKYLSSQQVQKEADRVYEAVQDVVFGNGKMLHFKKVDDIHTITSKSMNGCHYADPLHPSQYKNDEILYPTGQLIWMDDTIKVDIPWNDLYTSFSMDHDIAYCEITREMFDNGWHYYVRLYLDGPAPVMHLMGKGTTGIDAGVSTMAAMSDDKLHFDELAPKCNEYRCQIAGSNARMNASRRVNNPGNYNPDGTIKRGAKLKWTYSKTYKRLKRRLKTLYRKQSAYTECTHNHLANVYVSESDTFLVEEMDFQALAKRSKKKAERREDPSVVKAKDGVTKTVRKFKRKKRFGRSVGNRSPGSFLSTIKKKIEAHGGRYQTVDTFSVKASQYRHDTDTNEKVPLSQRRKTIDGFFVLRDPYSAFIIHNVNDALDAPDHDKCVAGFHKFLALQEEMILESMIDYPTRPACFGF